MVALIERLKKEWHVIKGAPFSFAIVCAVVIGVIWGGFRFVYRDKLAESEKRAEQWKDDVDYWKDLANRPKSASQDTPPQSLQPKSNISKPVAKSHILPTHMESAGTTTITGNQNVVGSNNQVNFEPPKRPPIAVDVLSKEVGNLGSTIEVQAVVNSQEAYEYALQIYKALKAANIGLGPDGIRSFMMTGEPWKGVEITFRGDPIISPTVEVPMDSPPGKLIQALQDAGVRNITVHHEPNFPVDKVGIFVGPSGEK